MQWLFTQGRGSGHYLIYFPTVGKLALVGWVWLLLGSQFTRRTFRLLPRSLGCCVHVRSSRAGSYAGYLAYGLVWVVKDRVIFLR